MIKRVIGVVFTILVFVVVIAAAINWGEYRSFLLDSKPEPRMSVERVEAAKPVSDSIATKKANPKKKLTPEQIEARKRAIAKKKAERAAALQSEKGEVKGEM